MISENLAQKVIGTGLELKADFVEIFIEETRDAKVTFRDSKIETATSGTDFGIGVRLLYGTESAYGFTSDDSEESLIYLTKQIAANRKTNHETTVAPVISFKTKNFEPVQRPELDPRNVGQKAKLTLLKTADKSARSSSPHIAQVSISAFDSESQIWIYNSEGLKVNDNRIRCRFSVSVTAEKNGERFSASENPGALRGFEFFESLDISKLAKEAAESSLRMLDAGYIEGKKMPVILGNGFGGVIFHEACGHPLETEAIRRKASPFTGKLGQQIANTKVTAIDDGTIQNSWGSISVDDEGHPPEKTVLIKDGILTSYISDRVGASEVNIRRTGSARRQSYQYAPVSRMRNTYIDAGNDSIEDMIHSIEDGLYAMKMGGGSVNPATGEFNFAVQEGYEIKNGKLGRPVRGASLIGRGHEVLPKISMVGEDLELTAGMCGASSGSVPVTVGQPTLKVDEILVGGR